MKIKLSVIIQLDFAGSTCYVTDPGLQDSVQVSIKKEEAKKFDTHSMEFISTLQTVLAGAAPVVLLPSMEVE